MAVIKRTVRITKVWDVEVVAEYGDDDVALLEKAQAPSSGGAELKNLLPEETE